MSFSLAQDNPLEETTSSANSSPQASSYSASAVNAHGAETHSSSSATAYNGETSTSQESTVALGATSASGEASATTSNQGAATTAQTDIPTEDNGGVQKTGISDADNSSSSTTNNATLLSDTAAISWEINVLWQFGTPGTDALHTTSYRDLLFGGAGADTFALSATEVTSLIEADVIFDFVPGEDQLSLNDGLTFEDIFFEIADLDKDGNQDATVIRSVSDETIVGVVIGTVDEQGQTLLSSSDFTDINADSSRVFPESDIDNGSSASSSSSSFANENGAGSNSSATATSSTGETSTSEDESYTSGATSSSSSASAEQSSEGSNTSATANSVIDSAAQVADVDVLMGTEKDDLIVGSEAWDVMFGNAGSDTFVLSIDAQIKSANPDLIADFSQNEGDLFVISGIVNLKDIVLKTVDLNGDNRLNGVSISNRNMETPFAVVINTLSPSVVRSTLTVEGMA